MNLEVKAKMNGHLGFSTFDMTGLESNVIPHLRLIGMVFLRVMLSREQNQYDS